MKFAVMQASNLARLESSMESKAQGRDSYKSAIEDHQKHAGEAYDQEMRQVEERRGARETLSVWTLLGTIIGGFGIGTAIGMAIGEAANDTDENEANDAKRGAGRADALTKIARDHFQDAQEALDEMQRTVDSAETNGRDLREQAWTGTV